MLLLIAAVHVPIAQAQQIVLPNFGSTTGLTLNSASTTTGPVSGDGTVLRLASATTNDVGSAFTTSLTNVSSGFSTSFSFRISSPGGATDSTSSAGADGISFVLQRVGATALGASGEGMGYSGISNSVGIEFDTFLNSNRGEPSSNHVGINTGGSVTSVATSTVTPSFDNAAKWTAWVDYNGSVLELRLSQNGIRPATAQLTRTINLGTTLGGSTAHLGFTSATGGAFGHHDLLSWAFSDIYSASGLTLYTWSGSGAWTDTARWNPAAVPGASDIALIGSGTATVADTRSLTSLQLSGGAINGAGSLTLTGSSSTWSGGNFNGPGSLTVASGAGLAISGSSAKGLFRSSADASGTPTLHNEGTISWTGGTISSGNSGVFNNKVGATFTTNFDGSLLNNQGGDRTVFTNAGTFTKSAGTGTTEIQATFNNSGNVTVTSGTLLLSGGGSSSGNITLTGAESKLRLASSNYAFAHGSVLSGPGSIEIASAVTTFSGDLTGSANIVIAGGNAAFNGNATTTGTATLSSGTLSGTGNVTIGGLVTLDGATLTGAGILQASGGAGLTDNFSFNGTRTLNLEGNSTWSNGSIYAGSGAVLNIKPGATLTSTANTILNGSYYSGATTVVNNQGTFTKSTATGTTDIIAVFHNPGTVNVQTGTLDFSAGGSSAGLVNVSANAILQLSGGNFTFDHSSQIAGAGSVRVAGGNTTFSGNNTGTAHIVIANGNAIFNGTTHTTGGGNLTGGTLDGTGTLAFGNIVTLGGTTLTGGGILNADAGAALAANFSFNGARTLNLAGNSTWSADTIYAGGGSILNVKPGATLTTTNNSTLYGTYYGGGTATTAFNNQGTFTKSTSTGTTDLTAVFNNSGLVNVQAGTLDLGGGGTHSGTVEVSSGATFALTGGNHTFSSGAVINGTGSLKVSGGNTTFSGATTGSANIIISGGNAAFNGTTSTKGGGTFSGGTLSGTGNVTFGQTVTLSGTTLTGAGILNADAGAALAANFSFNGTRTLNLGGNSTWSADYIHGGGGSILNVKPGATLTTTTNSTLNGTYYGGGATTTAFHNQGTFIKSTSTGITDITAVFNNSGLVNVQAGTLDLGGGGTHSGTVDVSSGATFALTGGNHTFSSGAVINGAGSLKVSGGNTTFSGATTGSANIIVSGGNAAFNGTTNTTGGATLSGGTLSGTGNVTFGQTVTLSGTTLTGAGILNADAGATLNGTFSFNGSRTVNLAGNSTWTTGYIYGGGNSVITVLPGATFTTSTNSTLNGAHYGGGAATTVFNNQGTFTKSTSTGITDLTAVFNNTSLVNVQAGTLDLGGGGTHTGTAHISSGATLALTGGNHTFSSGAVINGDGSLKVSGGNTTFSGATTGSANIIVHGGTAAFNGTTTTTGGGTFSSGTLTGTGQLTLGGPVTLSGTTLTGAGTLIAEGGALITGTFSFNGTRQLSLGGNSIWSAGYIYGGGGSTLTVKPGAQFTTTTNSTLNGSHYNNGSAGTTVLDNQGTFTKTTSTGTTDITAIVNNSGTISVQAGALEVRGGGTNTGTIEVASGAAFDIGGGTFTLGTGSSLTGSGALRISGGNATVSATVASPGTGNFTSGTLNGAGSLTFGGLLTLSGTTLSGTGTLATTTGAAITNSFSIKDGQILTLGGASTWTGGVIYTGTGAVINNSGTLNQTFNGTLHHYYGGTPLTFNNSGTFTKSVGTGTSDINALFQNTGTIAVQSGTLEFRSGGSSSGTVEMSSGATFAIDGGTFAFGAGSQILGAGTVLVSGGTATFAGSNTATANIAISSGNATFSGNTTTSGGGTFSGGTFNGPGHLTLGTPLTLSGTTLAGSGTLTASGGASIASAFSIKDGQTLTLAGNSTWGSATIYHGTGAVLNNTGTLTNTANSTLYHYYGGTKLTLNNSGTFIKSGATGTTDLNALFNNAGTINVQAGTLDLGGGGTSSGPISVATGATLLISGGLDIASGSQVSGAGLLRLSNGTLTLAGPLAIENFTQTGGRLAGNQTFSHVVNWQGGDWNATAAATTTIASGGTLNLSDHGSFDFNSRTLVNEAGGKVYWQTGHLRSGNGGRFVNHGEFHDQNVSSYSIYNPSFGGTYSFTNYGAYTRETTGTTYVSVPFHNHGTLTLTAGDLRLQGGGTMAATSVVQAAPGTHLYLLEDYTILDGAQFLGAGTFVQSSGTLTLDGLLKAPLFTWSGGDWNAAATGVTTTIASGTRLLLTDGGNKAFDRRAITIASGGTLEWQSGHLQGGNGSVFTNHGTFLDQNASSYSVYNPNFGGTYRFDNYGTYTRGTAGTTYFSVPFNNSGTVNLNTGDLRLQAGGTMAATSVVNAASGTQLYFTDSYTLLPGARLTGAGQFLQTSGTLTVDGALSASNFTWSGGNWNATAGGATTTLASGTTVTISGGGNKDFNHRTLEIASGGTLIWQSGHLRSGNGGAVVNHGTFNDQNTSGYDIISPTSSGFGGTFTFTNNGTYSKTTTGTTHINVPFVNNGTLSISAGAVVFGSTFTNNGGLAFSGGASLQSTGPISLGTSALTGTGTITASSVTAGGLVSPGNSPGTLTLTGNLNLLSTSSLLFELGGSTQGVGYDLLSVGGNAVLGGSLSLQFLNGFHTTMAPGSTFTVFTSAGLTGTFANIANGQKLLTSDGIGFFQVNYGTGSVFGANNIVLSHFTAVPEPSTYVMLGLGAGLILWQVRRRRK